LALAQALARRRVYYGWYIVGLVFVTNLTYASVGNFSPPVFLKSMTQEMHWSRTFFSMTVSLGMMMAMPISLFLGPLVDKRGARVPMMAGGVVLGGGLIMMGMVHTSWQFIVVRGMIVPLGIIALSQVTPTVVVANWFVKKRGRAMAVTTMGMAFGAMIATPVITYLIGALGWRQAWVVLGVAAWVLVLAPVALLMKRRPEDMGLLPDGETTGRDGALGRAQPRPEVTWTRREAMRTPTMWFLAFGFPLGTMGMGAINAHLYSHLTDIDFTTQTAGWIVMTISAVSLVVKPPWGLLAERISPRYCQACAFLIIGVGMGLLALVGPSRAGLFAATAVMGVGWGGLFILQPLIWANYYGRLTLGRVQSTVTPIQAVFSPLGPVLAGRVYDATGSYERIFLAFIGTQVVAAALTLLAVPPKKPQQAATPGKE